MSNKRVSFDDGYTTATSPTIVSSGATSVQEYANLAAFPPTGAADTIYITTDTKLLYHWSGSAYEVVSASSAVAWGAITGTLSAQTDLQTALDGKVDENSAITGATKTKITYDAKGLVTSGADATTADIADSTNKRYVTDAHLVVIGNTSGTNTGDQTNITGNSGSTDALKSATTTVNVSSATAPTTGQVLTATSDSAATWQTPSGGSSVAWAFGSGTDGNVTISAGTTTLTRDMFYNNLTINSTGSISTNGYRLFISGTLDLTAASASAIIVNATGGSTTGSTVGGAAGVSYTPATVAAAGAAGAGGTGSSGSTGGTGVAGTSGNMGGPGGAGGKGGNGTTANGGATRASTASGGSNYSLFVRYATDLLRGGALVTAGTGGSGGGGAGAGTGGNGAGGIGGAGGGGIIYIAANTVLSNGATASAINATGATSSNANSGGSSGTGGAGGGGGGGGGFVYFMYGTKGDTAATNLIDVSGGNGIAGGNSGSASGGDSGGGGGGGRVVLFNISTGVGSETYGGTAVAVNAASGTTGGTTVIGQQTKVSF